MRPVLRFFQRILSNEAFRMFGALAGAAAACASTVFFVIAGLRGGEAPASADRAIWALLATTVLFGAAALAAFGLIVFMRRKAARADVVEGRVLEVLTEFNKSLATDYLFCQFIDRERQNPDFDEDYISVEFHRYIDDMLDHVAKIFTIYTDKPCAASIKIFSESQTEKIELNLDASAPKDGVYVFTLGRNKASNHARSQVDEDGSPLAVYPYHYNTAFRRITHDPELCGYFAAEKLSGLSSKEYANARPDWRDHYDAVAVASLKNPTKKAVDQALGFLCVDNKYDGFIDNGTCREILESLASIAYYSIRKTIGLVRSKTVEKTEV